MLDSRPERPDGSFILPVWHCAGTVADSLDRLTTWLAADRERWELIVVDDGSDDGTPEIVRDWRAAHPERPLRLIRLSRNRGKGVAVRTGLSAARGEIALFTDADLPYGLDASREIVARIRHGAAAAIACRVLAESRYEMSPAFFSYLYTRHLMGRAFNRLCRTLVLPGVLDTQAGLKGLDLEFVRPLLSRMVLDGFSFDVELLRAIRDAGGGIAEVPVVFRYDSEPSTVRFVVDSLRMARDLVHVRWRSARGAWRTRDAPRIEIVADDFGLAPDIDRGIRALLEAGAISGASIIVGTAGSSGAIRWAAEHPEYDYGIHLNLTEGRPLLGASVVPSLVDAGGRFLPLRRFARRWIAGRIDVDQVRAEWTMQIDRLLEAGVRLRRLDAHQHVHLLPDLFREAALPLARVHRLRVRAMPGGGRPRFAPPDLRDLALRVMSRRALRVARGVEVSRGAGTTLLRNPTFRELRRIVVRAGGPGGRETTEIVVHPGILRRGRAARSRWDRTRGLEFELLTQPEVLALVETLPPWSEDRGSLRSPLRVRSAPGDMIAQEQPGTSTEPPGERCGDSTIFGPRWGATRFHPAPTGGGKENTA